MTNWNNPSKSSNSGYDNVSKSISTLFLDCLAYWKLDEASGTAFDVGKKYPLTNTAVGFGAGLINNGAVFGDASTARNLTYAGNWGDPMTSFSLNLWVNFPGGFPYTTTTFRRAFYSDTLNESSFGIDFRRQTSGAVRQVRFIWGASSTIPSIASLAWPQWHMFTMTYDAAAQTLSYYIDGVLGFAFTGQTAPSTGAGHGIMIGNITGDTSLWNGNLDEVGVWNRVITAAEVSLLYNSGKGFSLNPVFQNKQLKH